MTLVVVLAAVDPATATIIGALLTGSAVAGARMAPRTRGEASRDRAAANLDHVQAMALLVEQHRKDAAEWREELFAERARRETLEEEVRSLRRELATLRAQVGADRPQS